MREIKAFQEVRDNSARNLEFKTELYHKKSYSHHVPKAKNRNRYIDGILARGRDFISTIHFYVFRL